MLKILTRIRNRYLFVGDFLCAICVYCAMIALIFPLENFIEYVNDSIEYILITALIHCLCLSFHTIYSTDWVNAGARNYIRLISSCLISTVAATVVSEFIPGNYLFFKFNLAANVAVSTAICALRFSIRLFYKIGNEYGSAKSKRTLIIGAGRLSVTLMREISENSRLEYDIVGLIDDDPQKIGKNLYGSKVLGDRNDIVRICEKYRVDEIIFAIYAINRKERADILDICSKTGKKVKIFPGVEAALKGNANLKSIREIKIEDLLERDPIKLDNDLIVRDLRDKTVLVTGGGGSIGSELCRQIIKYNPERLIILDIYENTTYELQNELEEKYPDRKIDVLIASIRDKNRIDEIFSQYKPDVIFHAAAHKHVPLMEYSPAEAIKNNVFGTYNVAMAASEHNAKRFVMISTDKAVNPTNIMGATKRMCEMIVQTLQKYSKTEFVAVRFGNVLGSHGSVVPRFAKQIEAGGPITVTHPEITRFFMTIPEAAQLVLQAASYAKGGEIFVLDMGEPVKIYDLAKKMIRLYGYKPEIDIKIVFSGLRPGEKLYEELLMDEEGLENTKHSKIFIGQPIDMTKEELEEKLELLKNAVENEISDIKAAMAQAVPTYIYKKSEQKRLEMV